MQATTFETLRELVLHYAGRRGWLTQRQIAVMCGLDESALSRWLNGEQDIGARRTHALFQEVGIPVDRYDLAYALLGRAQESAQTNRAARLRTTGRTTVPLHRPGERLAGVRVGHAGVLAPSLAVEEPLPGADIPASVVIALFTARQYTGEQIAAFFAGDGA